MRNMLMAAVMLSLALAGCTTGAPTTDPDEDFSGLGLTADDDTGIIRGVIIDDAIVPIEGATVSILSIERTTTTTADGLFGFDGLEAGTYFLQVSSPLHTEIQRAVDVVAGDDAPPSLKIQLTRLPGTEPYVQAFDWEGYIGCTFRRPGVSGAVGAAGQSCPFVDTIWPEHDFLYDMEMTQAPTYVVSEQQWESTQEFGGEMSFNLRRTDTNRDTKDIEGTSPLMIHMNATEMELGERAGEPVGGFGADMPLRVIVFTAHLQETETAATTWGVGLQLEQSFNVYTHIFHNYQPPTDWSFIATGEVPQP